jgi:ArsR family transcriptional regulator
LALFFRVLGDETRVRIVALLAHGELCVCHVQEALGLSQPNASRHLTVLKHAGVVRSRRVGTWIHYALAPQLDEHRKRQLRALIAIFSGQQILRRDVNRLLKAKGPNACP